MKKYSRVRAIVDLDAIVANMDSMKRNVHEDTRMIAVVKANAYGHGVIPIAHALEERDYMWGFAVATSDEAMVLRKNDIKLPILVLGYSFEESIADLINNNVRITVFSYDMALTVSNIAKSLDKSALIHIKIDTGMSRIGFLPKSENVDEIVRISKLPNLCLEGMFTHFARADESDKAPTNKQMEAFLYMKDELIKRNVTFELYHCSNTASIIDMPETSMDAVRAGIATYGIYPSDDVIKENVPLIPALSLISHVINVKTLEPGAHVGYGGTYEVIKESKIATIPVGYGDGYPRSLSNTGIVLIGGKRAPIVGRVCMDQLMVDATGIDVSIGDEVILIGKSGSDEITVDELSALSGRFSYELVSNLGKRVPMEYLRQGEIVFQYDYF